MDAKPIIKRLVLPDLRLIGEIDRSEHMDVEYRVVAGELVALQADLEVPSWRSEGTGEHSVAGVIEFWTPVVAGGAVLLGAFERDQVLGLVIVDLALGPGLAWLAFLYVSRSHRRRGLAGALWGAAERIALDAGAHSLYVSAVPSGSAVGFYLSRGCELAESPHPGLFAKEPDDIHLVCRLDREPM